MSELLKEVLVNPAARRSDKLPEVAGGASRVFVPWA
jgi:hypothetical protein